MIIGHGDIAQVLKAATLPALPYATWFASGVSDSSGTRESEFKRERDLLQAQSGHVIYFSSLCVFYSDTPYARHKRDMEQRVRHFFMRYTIVRIGTITWGKNPNLLINFLRNRAAAGLPLDVQDVYRVIHTKADILYGLSLIPDWSCEFSCPGRLLKVADIVREYVTLSAHVDYEMAAQLYG